MQPRILPRPDLARLGVKYRRIPVLSIGRDVYLDTRLMLQKLEQLPLEQPRLAASANPEHRAIERLLETLVIDGGLFRHCVQLLPSNSPQMRDPAFLKDRTELIGGTIPFSPEALEAGRPEAIVEIKNVLEFLETTLLADGRKWLLKTETPSLADIEAVWPLHWIASIPGVLPRTTQRSFLGLKGSRMLSRAQHGHSLSPKPCPESRQRRQ